MPEPFPDWSRHFTEGASNPHSLWHNLALGTARPDGAPSIRTVVLRRFAGRTLDVHTDTRSAKYAELQANPAATLHGWDPDSRIQLRTSGRVSLHVNDATAQQSWTGLRDQTRATYRVQPGPGTPLPTPDNATPDAADAEAQRIFCVIRLRIETLDWLHLAQGSHRRARFTWDAGGMSATWLVP